MSDELDKVGLPKEMSETQVLSKFASDPDAEEIHNQLKDLFEGNSLKVYRKDQNLLTLIEHTKTQRSQYPLIDKNTRLVYVLSSGNHVVTMACLYYFIKSKQGKKKVSWSDYGSNVDTAADNYIKEGFGYYFTLAGKLHAPRGLHMVYGADYRQDRNDKAVFETYERDAQMLGVPKAVRDALDTLEIRKAEEDAERAAAEAYLKKQKEGKGEE